MSDTIKQAMVRQVRDDFEVLLMCDAMLACGVTPFSVVFAPTGTDGVTGMPFPKGCPWSVFAIVPGADSKQTIGRVDALFDQKMAR